MIYGEPLNKSFQDDFQTCPYFEIKAILESILSSNALQKGLPTIAQLLELPYVSSKSHLI